MGKITFLDGASGTLLWDLAAARGIKRMPVFRYNLEAPDLPLQVGKAYVEAGSEILLANTFSANPPAVQKEGLSCTEEIIRAGISLGKQAASGKAAVAADFGPLMTMLEPYGDLEEEEARDIYRLMCHAANGAGADLFVLETFLDLELMKIAAQEALAFHKPVFCSFTFDKSGRTMMGNSPKDIADALTPLGVSAVGINCSMGPVDALQVLREFKKHTDLPLLFKPNAGLPVTDAEGHITHPYTADLFAKECAPAFDLADYMGGCCGTNPDCIRALIGAYADAH